MIVGQASGGEQTGVSVIRRPCVPFPGVMFLSVLVDTDFVSFRESWLSSQQCYMLPRVRCLSVLELARVSTLCAVQLIVLTR